MMESLLFGVSPSKVFRALQQENYLIDARKLGIMLSEEYPEISPAASISILRWLNTDRGYEFPDEQMDGLITHYLKAAGYIP